MGVNRIAHLFEIPSPPGLEPDMQADAAALQVVLRASSR